MIKRKKAPSLHHQTRRDGARGGVVFTIAQTAVFVVTNMWLAGKQTARMRRSPGIPR